jgi:hypothetical protein
MRCRCTSVAAQADHYVVKSADLGLHPITTVARLLQQGSWPLVNLRAANKFTQEVNLQTAQ